METAGEEEKAIALLEGDVDRDGVPLITVITDGMWGKRSYKNKYDSLSGTASIVGMRTKKVLFCGVRNKFCHVYALASYREKDPTPHECFFNWRGSSTSMEADITVEGFKRSEEMHGIRYHQFIADGDSSVHKRLLEAMPYGPLRKIKKIECKNHLLRNLRSTILEISRNIKLSRPSALKVDHIRVRKMLSCNMLRFASGISKASKHHQKQPGSVVERKQGLIRLNTPAHIFGDHSQCANYFCNPAIRPSGEDNLVSLVQKVGLWSELMRLLNRYTDRAGSLLHNASYNMCEVANSVTAKFLSGKRLFYSGRRSYNVRCSAAVLSLNTSGDFHTAVHKTMHPNESPGMLRKKFTERKKRKLANNRIRRKLTWNQGDPKRRKKQVIYGPDKDYGPQPEPVVGLSEQSKSDYISSLILNEQARKDLQQVSQGSDEWMSARRGRLTASYYGEVCRRLATTSCKRQVHKILYSTVMTSAMRHGRNTEDIAREKLRTTYGFQIQQCGLFVDEEVAFLASPDGLIGLDTLVEIKCPTTAGDYESAMKAVQAGKIPYLEINKPMEHYSLKKNAHYYYQIQGQLHVTRRQECVFFVYTKQWEFMETVNRDDSFWSEKMETQLKRFYMQALLPELLLSRYGLRHKIDDILEAEFVTATKQTQQ